MASETTKLDITAREPGGSRVTRRLRRKGRVPGILYGGDGEPLAFEVGERELRHALAATGAVVELVLDGKATSAVLKDSQRNPVRGDTLHVDFVRVDLKVAIQSPVPVHLLGGDEAPGVKEGGVLDQVTREVTVEALPNDIPESIDLDVSGLEAAATLTLADLVAPPNVTIVDDPELVLATITVPTAEPAEDEIEEETQVVGEGGAAAEGEAAGGEGAGAGESSASE